MTNAAASSLFNCNSRTDPKVRTGKEALQEEYIELSRTLPCNITIFTRYTESCTVYTVHAVSHVMTAASLLGLRQVEAMSSCRRSYLDVIEAVLPLVNSSAFDRNTVF